MSHPLTKIMVAKAQLVTALDLFIRDKDPISVQCLACGGGEVVEALAEAVGKDVFATHILQTQPGMDRKADRALRNQYWNAFKHFSRRDGIRREDEDLLHRFDDKERRRAVCRLVDYAVAQKKLPVAVQVFQVCWCAINEEKPVARCRYKCREDRVPRHSTAVSNRAKTPTSKSERKALLYVRQSSTPSLVWRDSVR